MKFSPLALIIVISLFASSQSFAKDWLYSVRPGDTLWSLCLKYTSVKDCWVRIGPYNNVDYPKTMAPGIQIKFPLGWLKTPPRPVELVFFSGAVEISELANTRTNTPASKHPGKMGEKLGIGSRIDVFDNSSATIKFADGTIMVLEQNSRLDFDILSTFDGKGIVDTRVNLRRGAGKVSVPKRSPRSKFRISTPSAVAAVRGTVFRMEVAGKDADVSLTGVLEGIVQIYPVDTNIVEASEQRQNSDKLSSVTLTEGFGLRTEKGKALKQPEPLLSPPEFINTSDAQIWPVKLQWQALSGAIQYQLLVLQDIDNSSDKATDTSSAETIDKTIDSINTQETQNNFDTLAPGCFRFRVSALAANQLQGVPQEQRICAAKAIAPPVLNNKTLRKQNQHISLEWQSTERASAYVVEVSRKSDFSNLAHRIETTDTQITLPQMTGKTVHIRVRALDQYQTEHSPSEHLTWKESKKGTWKIITSFILVALFGLL